MPNENDNKLVTLADLAEAYNALYNRDVMDASDKTKLDGIQAGAQVNTVTSVNNQTGAVSLTPANIGAVNKAGDTMTGQLKTPSVELIPEVGAARGGFVDFHYSGEDIDYTSRIIENAKGQLNVNGVHFKYGDIIQEGGYLRGSAESDLNHAIKLGHANDNVMEFNEYGGLYNFYRSASNPRELIFQLNGTAGDSAAPLPVTSGGTGATTAAVTITNDYSSVLNAINAVRNTRIFPISIQKYSTSSYSDMPTGYETYEWNLLLVGDRHRLTATLYIYPGKQKMFIRDFFEGSWSFDYWTQVV